MVAHFPRAPISIRSSLPGLTRQSIFSPKSSGERRWTRGSSPRVTSAASNTRKNSLHPRDIRVGHHLGPFGDVLRHPSFESVGGSGHGFAAELAQPLDHG